MLLLVATVLLFLASSYQFLSYSFKNSNSASSAKFSSHPHFSFTGQLPPETPSQRDTPQHLWWAAAWWRKWDCRYGSIDTSPRLGSCWPGQKKKTTVQKIVLVCFVVLISNTFESWVAALGFQLCLLQICVIYSGLQTQTRLLSPFNNNQKHTRLWNKFNAIPCGLFHIWHKSDFVFDYWF